MGKDIIFFSDGTRNDSEDKTNVFVAYKNIVSKNRKLVKEYDIGVGNQFGRLVRGAVLGKGLDDNVKQGFKFISNNYEEGDKIYLFGFSRGAYTVRSLASMISLCGLAPKDAFEKESSFLFFEHYSDAQEACWETYLKNRNEVDFTVKRDFLVSEHKVLDPPPIEAVCVWDTVGVVGFRQARSTDLRDKMKHDYHRMSIYPQVKRFYHAVSLDERRVQYWPHLTIGQANSTTEVEEVWFPGVHSDVGGAYNGEDGEQRHRSKDEDKLLGNISLLWMLNKLKGDLDFKEGFLESLEKTYDPCAKMHNSEDGLAFRFFKKKSRAVRRHSNLHRSIHKRIEGPLMEHHQHREPSGNYMPNALNFAKYLESPDFGIEDNYNLVD